MSHLNHIIQSVQRSGVYEEQWHALINAYFRGNDCFEQIEKWARDNGLSVAFSSESQMCTFRTRHA
jgi:hypothetical protein